MTRSRTWRIDAFFAKDTKKAVAAAKSQAAKAGIKDAKFIVYLASVNFQLGTRWYTIHKKTWRLILDGDYAGRRQAGLARRNGPRRTPVRVKDFKKALLALPQADPSTGPGQKQRGANARPAS